MQWDAFPKKFVSKEHDKKLLTELQDFEQAPDIIQFSCSGGITNEGPAEAPTDSVPASYLRGLS